MKSLRLALFLSLSIASAWLAPAAFAAWIWSPQTGWVGPSGAVKDTPEEQLEVAVGLFEQEDIDGARIEFKKLLNAYKDSREGAEAQYYLGRCAAAKRDYYRAFLEYRKAIQTYPSTKRFEEILELEYRIGNMFLAGKKRKVFGTAALLPARDKAIEIFQAIVEDGPYSEHGLLAQYKLGMAHLLMHDYEEAVSAFEQMISQYPESELVDDARFQIAMASLKGTFKADYDSTPTKHAIRELQAFMQSYPDSDLALEAKTRLDELKELRAEHAYQVAEFYEQRGHPDSALVYYATVVDEYADTSWALKAAVRVQVLGLLRGR